MARVNVEHVALSDSRYDLLAQLAGLADRDHALGKMVRVWNECQERESYSLTGPMLDAIIGKPSSGDLLTQSGLAKRLRNSRFYICGTQGRIEWLRKRREEGRKGGKLGGRPTKPLGDSKQKPLGVNGNATGGNPSGSYSGSYSEEVSSGSSESSPKTGDPSNPERRTPKPPRASRSAHEPPGFKAAWNTYPHFEHRSVRADSLKAWTSLDLEPKAETVLAWIEAERDTSDWTNGGGRYVKGFQSWIRKRNFDQPPAPVSMLDKPMIAMSEKERRSMNALKNFVDREKVGS